MSDLILPRTLFEAMIAHARRESPLEACGIVGGREGRAVRFHPTRNAEQSEVRYSIDPREILAVLRALDREGLSLAAIFHSHPKTEAYPSPTDIRLAFYPGALYLICSLAGPEPVLRGFWLQDGQVQEGTLEIVEDSGGVAHGH